MSFKNYKEIHSCPCGKGNYEIVHSGNDSHQHEEFYNMLCPECKEKYTYSDGILWDSETGDIAIDWGFKLELETKRKYRESVEKKAKEIYYNEWRDCFTDAKTKKEIWGILTQDGKYDPSLSTFYNNTKGLNGEKMLDKIDGYFNYSNLKRVFEICKVNPDDEELGLNCEDKAKFRPFTPLKLDFNSFNPSEVISVQWLKAHRKHGSYPKATSGGKWLIFANIKDIDGIWEKVKKATEDGKLGQISKVSTMHPNPFATEPDTKVICVYTYDWKDEKDVKAIREELRKIGITKKIPYKSDEDTANRKYRNTGHTRISKYYE